MKLILNFSLRNVKEVFRDLLSWIFAIILPLILLWVFQQFDIPNESYKIENFTPGIIIFGFSFLSMFSALLVSEDRSTSFLIRLGASPMKSHHYILGYYVSLLPLALLQMILFFLLAIPLGLKFSIGVLLCVLVGLLVSTLFIFLGILIGCITTQKSSSGLSSAVVQLVAFTSGMYFSTEMIGGFFSVLCKILPFKSCLDLLKGVSLLSFTDLLLPILVFTGYTILIVVLAVIVFKNSLYSSKK